MNAKRKMFLQMIFAALIRRKSRMVIALLAIVVGATVLFGLFTIYYDIPRQMGAEFRNYGANMIITPSGDENLTDSEVEEAIDLIDKDDLVGYTTYKYETVKVHEQPVVLAGITYDTIQKTSPYWSVTGDYPETEAEVLIGQNVAEMLSLSLLDKFEASITNNNEYLDVTSAVNASNFDSSTYYTLNDGTYTEATSYVEGTTYYTLESAVEYAYTYKVVGIVETGGSEEDYIYVSNDTLYKFTNTYSYSGTEFNYTFVNEEGYDLVELSVSGSKVSTYAEAISNALANATAKAITRLTSSEGAVLKKLQSLILVTTLIVLVLTMICVATTMNAVVNERRKEIALCKSIGASNKDIITEFLVQSIVLGFFGGIIGSFAGFGFAEYVSIQVFKNSITFVWWLLPITLVVSIAVTALASLLPIRSAAKVNAAVVLKGE